MDSKNGNNAKQAVTAGSKLLYFPWYTFLLPLFYVFHGYVNYRAVVSLETSYCVAGEYILATLVILGAGMLVLRDFRKAAFLAFLVNIANFYLGIFQEWMIQHNILAWGAKISLLLIAYFLIIIFVLVKFGRFIRTNSRLVSFLNLLMALFILIDFIAVFSEPVSGIQAEDMKWPVEWKGPSQKEYDSLPDVYFILLDEYAGTIALKEGMGFTNDEFLNFLREKGFFVADSSRSNYNSTLYSMASILNMTYLPVTEAIGENRSDVRLAYNSIANNSFSALLQMRGYEFYNNSWFSMRNVTQLPNSSHGRAERDFISAQTVLNRFRRNGLLAASRKFNWEKLERKIKEESKVYNAQITANLEEQIKNDKASKPRFYYSHFSMPHYPFFFDHNGYAYSLDSLAQIADTDSGHYLAYLKYCNSKIQELVEKIILEAQRPFKIFIVSDHGYRKMPGLSWEKRAYISLFAVYDSRGRKSSFPHTVTNVNVFRYWLNEEFQDRFTILADSFFRVRFQE